MSIEYGLVFTFFCINAIFHIRFFLSRLLYLALVNLKLSSVCHYLVFADKFFLCQKKKQQKKIFNTKVASHRYYVRRLSVLCKLSHECEDITKNAWRTPLNAQCNIKYQFQYSLFFTFLNYHQKRLFPFFLVNY